MPPSPEETWLAGNTRAWCSSRQRLSQDLIMGKASPWGRFGYREHCFLLLNEKGLHFPREWRTSAGTDTIPGLSRPCSSPCGGRDALHGNQGYLGVRPTYFPNPMLSLCIPATLVSFQWLIKKKLEYFFLLWQSECTLSFKTCLNSSEKPPKTATLPLPRFPLSELPSLWWQATSTHLSLGTAKSFSRVLPVNTKLLHWERSVLHSERSDRSETCNFVMPMPGECSGDVVQSVNTWFEKGVWISVKMGL